MMALAAYFYAWRAMFLHSSLLRSVRTANVMARMLRLDFLFFAIKYARMGTAARRTGLLFSCCISFASVR